MTRLGRALLALVWRPARAGLFVGKGDVANRRGDWGAAEAAYARALALRPELTGIRVQYGHALKEQGFLHEARAAYRQAAQDAVDPSDARAMVAEVEALLARANLDGADPAEVALLERHGLTPAVLAILDEAFYRAAHPALADRAALLDHVATAGLAKLAPLNARDAFDPVFYRATYLSGRPLAPERAYRHWLNVGLPRGWSANRAALLDALFGPVLRRLDGAALTHARAALATEAMQPPGATMFGWMLDPPEPDAAAEGLLPMLADRLSAAGLHAAALALRDRILAQWPAAAAVRRGLATDLMATGALDAARAALDNVDRSLWIAASYATLAACAEAAGDRLGAIAQLGEGMRAFPGDAGMRRTFDILADRAIHDAWDAGLAEAVAGRADTGRFRIDATLDAVLAAYPQAEPARPAPIRSVAILGNADLPQCRFYRIDQKLELFAAAGIAATFYDEHADVPRFLAELTRHQAVIAYRVPAHLHIIDAILSARIAGLVTFYEIDDLLFDAAHFPPDLASYGGQIAPADHAGLQIAPPMYARAMRLCDYGLASTPVLAAHMRPLVRTGQAVVHRNGLGAAHLRQAARLDHAAEPDRPVTLFYGSGTKAHKADVEALLEPALLALAARFGAGLRIVLAGYSSPSPCLLALGARLSLVELLPVEDYWDLLGQVDINLAVLSATPLNDTKSEIKWLEAAVLGVPSVVSATATYRAVIQDGITGFLCDTPEDWLTTLTRLVEDAPLRRRVGAAARAQALVAYGPAAGAESLRALVRGVSPTAPARPTVLFCNVFYPPQAVGGATRVLHDNVRAFAAGAAERFRCEVFTTAEGLEPYRLRSDAVDGVRVTRITTPDRADVDRVVDDPAIGAAFGRLLDDLQPAIVHFHCVQRLSVAVVEAARARRIPYLITLHDGWWISPHQFVLDADGAPALYDYADPDGTARRLGAAAADRMARLKPALAGAAAVLAVSRPFAELHTACGVPNVHDLANGVPAGLRAERHPPPDARVRLGFLGGFAPHKGWGLIRAAFAARRFEGLSLLVVDHAMTPGDRRIEDWDGTPVTFVPGVPQAVVADLYGAIDVLLAPSLWPEAYGLVTREALACGCWVVASDRGAIGEPVTEGVDGFVVDVADAAGLVDVLARIAADPARFRASPPRPAVPLRTAGAQAAGLLALYAALVGEGVTGST